MMNVGENRAQNGVLDCPESKKKITKCWSTGPIAVRDGGSENPPRYAMNVKYLRFPKNFAVREAQMGFWSRRKHTHFHHQNTILKPPDRKFEARKRVYKF
ncbi:hypothetical protein E3N88_15489 [Mikania micrantha]|uniref:Uncharacterized protein n=1 Tax=Mikania micrantha TaxID=192012 RepID=A0A5N6NVR3_9ASTR|nr:hypothetical protein E3N88_15489 [Mikania micrantha]